jgi:hypothetical protein
MNKKVLGIAVVLMVVAMLALPMISSVQAWGFRRVEKIEGVTATLKATQIPDSTTDYGRIRLIKGHGDGTVTIDIPGESVLEGTSHGEWTVTAIFYSAPISLPDPDSKVVIITKFLWTVTGGGKSGTFEGWSVQWITGMPAMPPPAGAASSQSNRLVLWGTDDFEGQKLVLSAENFGGTSGYMLMP